MKVEEIAMVNGGGGVPGLLADMKQLSLHDQDFANPTRFSGGSPN